MKQLSLVAWYGAKPAPLKHLIERCIASIERSPLAAFFQPYALTQIHATIVGMERAEAMPGHVNANLAARCETVREMNYRELAPTLDEHLPMVMRFGGFTPGQVPFLSASLPPYERSFGIDPSTGRCVLIGWPDLGATAGCTRPLQALREAIEARCHIAHKYRDDNDAYLVLGRMNLPGNTLEPRVASVRWVRALELEVREFLATGPAHVALSHDDLCVAVYREPSLEPADTVRFPLAELRSDPDEIRRLYQL